MVTIIFESHGTTFDNEAHLASGHYDVDLSPLGKQQARELGTRYASAGIDAIFCSDLQRSYKTAELAFPNSTIPIFKDMRLRECDYGDLTRGDKEKVDKEKSQRIVVPFPNGESYKQAASRIKNFLYDLMEKYDGKIIMIIGHRATQYGLEHWINQKPLHDVVTAPWRWQPGWKYVLKKLQ